MNSRIPVWGYVFERIVWRPKKLAIFNRSSGHSGDCVGGGGRVELSSRVVVR